MAGGVNIYGQLIRAQLEQWAVDPSAGVTGRIGYNSVTNRFELDNGTSIINVITDQSTVNNYLDWLQVSAPAAPASGSTRVYMQSDGNLYAVSSGNVVSKLTNAGATTANYLYNSDLAIWQRGTSFTVTSAANPTSTPTYKYGPDRHYVNNVLGGGTVQGIITISQVTGVTNGSAFGCKLLITTAPTGTNIQNGCEVYQVLENLDSLQFYNQNASFGVLVLGFGNVNQVGVQFCYSTTEVKPTVFIGSEVLVTVNTSTMTLCSISSQALGTSQTKAGVIGVRVRITNVSSGNKYDLNNGFSFEQPFMNLGGLATWSRKNKSFSSELFECQRYCERLGNNVASDTAIFGSGFAYSTTQTLSVVRWLPKRAIPGVTFGSAASGFTVNWGGSATTLSAIAATALSTVGGYFLGTATGVATNQPHVLYANTAAASFIIDAEI